MLSFSRLSRIRKFSTLRDMLRETKLNISDFIYPVFVEEEIENNIAIKAMPGQYRIAEKNLEPYIKHLYQQGVRAVILFGISHHKDEKANDSLNPNGTLARIVSKAKNATPDMIIIADNCFCEYTSHGHCGILENGLINNDVSIKLLAEQAVLCAQSGCDMVAPSAMLDGQVAAIRTALDKANFIDVPIMAYAVKYASCFYGPFREAANSTIEANNIYTDRKTYQMDINNSREALQEAYQDEKEKADILMIKPAGMYLDIIAKIKNNTNLPIAAYQVSGEYSTIKFAAQHNVINEDSAIIESLTAIKRAGANLIISYFTPQIIKLLH